MMWQKRFKLITFGEIDSTNSEALRLAKSSVAENHVIWAESQTGGRGRYGRIWNSELGNLYMSILLQSDEFLHEQSQLSFVASLSVYEAIKTMVEEQNIALNMRLKWPNDILIDSAKVSGILLESIKYNNSQYLVIGIGINVNDAPVLQDRKTTSLCEVNLGSSVIGVLDSVMNSFMTYYDLWRNEGFLKIRELWLERSYRPGEMITFSDGANVIEGSFIDIDANGSIRLKLSSGQIYTNNSGEVFFGGLGA